MIVLGLFELLKKIMSVFGRIKIILLHKSEGRIALAILAVKFIIVWRKSESRGSVVSTVVVSVVSVVSVMTSSVMVRVAEVLRDGTLGTGVSDCTTAIAIAPTVVIVVVSTGVGSRLELLLNSAVLVLAIVVKIVAMAATSGFVVSLVTSAATASTSVDGRGVNSFVILILGLLNVSGTRVRATEVAWDLVVMVVITLDLRGAGNGSEASKSKGLEHIEYLHPGSAQPI